MPKEVTHGTNTSTENQDHAWYQADQTMAILQDRIWVQLQSKRCRIRLIRPVFGRKLVVVSIFCVLWSFALLQMPGSHLYGQETEKLNDLGPFYDPRKHGYTRGI
jgi:hypothetical protein